jgi:hypothetical protein
VAGTDWLLDDVIAIEVSVNSNPINPTRNTQANWCEDK